MYSIKRTFMFIGSTVETHCTLATDFIDSKNPRSNCIPGNTTKHSTKHLSEQAPEGECCGRPQDAGLSLPSTFKFWASEQITWLYIVFIWYLKEMAALEKLVIVSAQPHSLMPQHTLLCAWGWSRLRNWVSEHSPHANCTHCVWLSLWETECLRRDSGFKIFT